MSREEFDQFIERKQKEKEEASSSNTREQISIWIAHLDSLYERVETYLQDYIKNGTATVSFQSIDIFEEFSGTYEARQMSVLIGAATVLFKPIGTKLIGSRGRVDVVGPLGIARLGLISHDVTQASQMIRVTVNMRGDTPPEPEPTKTQITWVWKIITPPPAMKFLELNEENFFDMIIGIVDG